MCLGHSDPDYERGSCKADPPAPLQGQTDGQRQSALGELTPASAETPDSHEIEHTGHG